MAERLGETFEMRGTVGVAYAYIAPGAVGTEEMNARKLLQYLRWFE